MNEQVPKKLDPELLDVAPHIVDEVGRLAVAGRAHLAAYADVEGFSPRLASQAWNGMLQTARLVEVAKLADYTQPTGLRFQAIYAVQVGPSQATRRSNTAKQYVDVPSLHGYMQQYFRRGDYTSSAINNLFVGAAGVQSTDLLARFVNDTWADNDQKLPVLWR